MVGEARKEGCEAFKESCLDLGRIGPPEPCVCGAGSPTREKAIEKALVSDECRQK